MVNTDTRKAVRRQQREGLSDMHVIVIADSVTAVVRTLKSRRRSTDRLTKREALQLDDRRIHLWATGLGHIRLLIAWARALARFQ